jgi:hypothetical protein
VQEEVLDALQSIKEVASSIPPPVTKAEDEEEEKKS